MLSEMRISLEELFSGYLIFWMEVNLTDLIKVLYDKDVSEMTLYSEKEMLKIVNEAYLGGPFRLWNVLMPSERIEFLTSPRKKSPFFRWEMNFGNKKLKIF